MCPNCLLICHGGRSWNNLLQLMMAALEDTLLHYHQVSKAMEGNLLHYLQELKGLKHSLHSNLVLEDTRLLVDQTVEVDHIWNMLDCSSKNRHISVSVPSDTVADCPVYTWTMEWCGRLSCPSPCRKPLCSLCSDELRVAVGTQLLRQGSYGSILVELSSSCTW